MENEFIPQLEMCRRMEPSQIATIPPKKRLTCQRCDVSNLERSIDFSSLQLPNIEFISVTREVSSLSMSDTSPRYLRPPKKCSMDADCTLGGVEPLVER